MVNTVQYFSYDSKYTLDAPSKVQVSVNKDITFNLTSKLASKLIGLQISLMCTTNNQKDIYKRISHNAEEVHPQYRIKVQIDNLEDYIEKISFIQIVVINKVQLNKVEVNDKLELESDTSTILVPAEYIKPVNPLALTQNIMNLN